MTSLLLDRTTWDLVLDSAGNMAVCSAPYSVIQDVACALRVFLGECYYDTTKGLPYMQNILGQYQSISVFREQARQVAMSVSGVSDAQVVLTGINAKRQLAGFVVVATSDGTVSSVWI
ncbi:hypothetical protein [Acetobacter sp.]|uniref:hypothetical protein n=1 Tax=Acetobacter sp. TaxID=440 RepID=UPI0039EBB03E